MKVIKYWRITSPELLRQVVAVPDALAAEKVPPVAGLLEYRKDNKKLYIRSNGTWNVIGEEQKVK
jgi:hypothetical protein